MASGPTMTAPICLVENQEEQLTVNQKALQILEKISQPVVVVAIAGLYRTGKSYLMNRLAGQNHGFQLGSTVRCETRGIWMWCVSHPIKPNHTLVLLDTEGLGDMEKGDPKNDSWIFALTVLLSSILIYNSMGTINHLALEQLHFITELTELIRIKSSSSSDGTLEDSVEFVSFFPDFIWTVRDFMLEMKINDSPITEDEYLEDALKLIPGTNRQIHNSNMPRECIRLFFPKRKCFVFDRPTSDKYMLFHIDNVPEEHLDSNFRMQSKNFCSYIFAHGRPKTLREGIIVTGNRLGTLVVTYVNAIRRGMVPCLENAVITLAQSENSAAVQKAASHYSEQMAQRVSLPTDTLQELLDVHAACEQEAVAIFMEHSFKDDKREFQQKLMANDILQHFQQSQMAIEESILQGDRALTSGQKALAAEQLKKEAAEKEQQMLRQKQQEQLQKLEVQEKSFKEHMVQLREKMKREREDLLREQERILEHKLKVQQELLNEGFKKKSEKMCTEIQQLRKEITANKTYSFGSRIFDTIGSFLSVDVPSPAEQDKKEADLKKLELLRQIQTELQQKMEVQERHFKENLAQLKKDMEKERENFLRKQERILEHKLKVQQELLNEGFKKKSEKMRTEIQQLRKEITANKKDERSFTSWLFDVISSVLGIEMPSPAEQAKKELTEKEWELQRQIQKELQQIKEVEERHFQENLAQLKDEMEREREKLLREQERMLEQKLKTLEISSIQRKEAQIPQRCHCE
ncbi:guanylate-binding protein 4-like isoform X2 [Manis pentadactyla]|uniref:guanylate-binding protein 4-like isoform X2 n=1 Tax=Manis pentadactyla TaxID=143292 RepID=UPI00187561DE|nr:guanylate-binding protein 4-like isoform X2 [Manis pentadactyla]